MKGKCTQRKELVADRQSLMRTFIRPENTAARKHAAQAGGVKTGTCRIE